MFIDNWGWSGESLNQHLLLLAFQKFNFEWVSDGGKGGVMEKLR